MFLFLGTTLLIYLSAAFALSVEIMGGLRPTEAACTSQPRCRRGSKGMMRRECGFLHPHADKDDNSLLRAFQPSPHFNIFLSFFFFFLSSPLFLFFFLFLFFLCVKRDKRSSRYGHYNRVKSRDCLTIITS